MNRLRNRLDRDRDDSGMTLVELMVTSTVLILLLGMVFISITMVEGLSGSVTSQYQEFQQALPAMAPFHSLVAAEVEPAPSVAGVPSPGFSTPRPTFLPASLPPSASGELLDGLLRQHRDGLRQHRRRVRRSSCPGGGTTAGPAVIVAMELDSSGNPATACSPNSPVHLPGPDVPARDRGQLTGCLHLPRGR